MKVDTVEAINQEAGLTEPVIQQQYLDGSRTPVPINRNTRITPNLKSVEPPGRIKPK